jgi:hypothetical protein
VTYALFAGACATGTQVGTDTQTIVNGSVPHSKTFGPLGAGSYNFDVTYNPNGDPNYTTTSTCEPFTVAPAPLTPSTTLHDGTAQTGATATDSTTLATVVNGFIPTGSVTYSFYTGTLNCDTTAATQMVSLNPDGSVPDSSPSTALRAGNYSYKASYTTGDANYSATGPSSCEPFTIAPIGLTPMTQANSGTGQTGATPFDTATLPQENASIEPTGTVTYTLFSGACGSGTQVGTDTQTIAPNGTVPQSKSFGPLGAGSYYFVAAYNPNGDTNYTAAAPSACETFTLAPIGLTPTTVSNDGSGQTGTSAYDSATFAPQNSSIKATGTVTYEFFPSGACTGSPAATVQVTVNADGSVPASNTVSGGTFGPLVPGSYAFDASFSSGDSNYTALAKSACEPLTVTRAAPTAPTITNLPVGAVAEQGGFIASVVTNGDGTGFVVSETPAVCSVGGDGLTVSYVSGGTCTLTPEVNAGTLYLGGVGGAQSFGVAPPLRGYWLVGTDGGIFSFGRAQFYGSMGGIPLQRPVVGITPTASRHGYWLVATDGGAFSFGDSAFYGSIPGLGLHPAGSGFSHSLNAPIVGMVPSTTGHGYFMVASDGGVFAFGDARFAGSCPGIGGCAGPAVAVMPDGTGNGYWLVTAGGGVYTFGDAPFYGTPPPQATPVVDAVASPDGNGYWIVYASGAVYGFGDAGSMGAPVGYVNVFNPATAIFPTSDGRGYWVAAARGDVFSYGDAPFLGSMAAAGLNGQIIAGFGF